jgi:hypothetical protein
MTAPGEFDAAAATKYMSPYQTNVTDAWLRQKLDEMQIYKKSGRGMGSISRGTFGGGRQALMEGQADRDLQTQLAKIGRKVTRCISLMHSHSLKEIELRA